MAGIKGKDTKPELLVRKALFAQGYRFRLHNKQLPGKPDLVLKKYNAAIFINGCYWHGHEECHLFRPPKSNQEFWNNKITGNKARDAAKNEELLSSGWRVLTVWECSLKGNKGDVDEVTRLICSWLKQDEATKAEIRFTEDEGVHFSSL